MKMIGSSFLGSAARNSKLPRRPGVGLLSPASSAHHAGQTDPLRPFETGKYPITWSWPFKGAHFAVFPEEIPRRCILASTKPEDVVLDPFLGSGTTMKVALELGRNCIGIELNAAYLDIIQKGLQSLR